MIEVALFSSNGQACVHPVWRTRVRRAAFLSRNAPACVCRGHVALVVTPVDVRAGGRLRENAGTLAIAVAESNTVICPWPRSPESSSASMTCANSIKSQNFPVLRHQFCGPLWNLHKVTNRSHLTRCLADSNCLIDVSCELLPSWLLTLRCEGESQILVSNLYLKVVVFQAVGQQGYENRRVD